jgi:hypothetical protein
MRKLFFAILFAAGFMACTQQPAEQKAATPVNPSPVEFADQKYIEAGKKLLDAYQRGDIDAWMSNFADNAVYQWNNLDSVAGKAAIDEYWRKRRLETTDTIIFSNTIFLPVKVNQPQALELPGVWLLTWYQIDVTYNNGNKISELVHADYHFDAAGKIDRALQYLDRAPINAALAAK